MLKRLPFVPVLVGWRDGDDVLAVGAGRELRSIGTPTECSVPAADEACSRMCGGFPSRSGPKGRDQPGKASPDSGSHRARHVVRAGKRQQDPPGLPSRPAAQCAPALISPGRRGIQPGLMQMPGDAVADDGVSFQRRGIQPAPSAGRNDRASPCLAPAPRWKVMPDSLGSRCRFGRERAAAHLGYEPGDAKDVVQQMRPDPGGTGGIANTWKLLG